MLFNVMGVDACQYAAISQDMMRSGSYLEVFYRGEDYLDKPPFLFWVSSISFDVFGVSNWSYKLPTVLSTVIGAISIFRLAGKLYGEEVGKISTLILVSCQAYFLINHDVRTDTILVNALIFTLWHTVQFIRYNAWSNLIALSFGIAVAMMTKGPIGIMVPAVSVLTHIALSRNWNILLNWKWLLVLVLVGAFISPMAYGLYTQFDAQPDKAIPMAAGMKMKGVSGLWFYFWEQSFGRITGGNNRWRNDAGYFFFVHTYAWSFLPWTLLGLIAIFKEVKSSFTERLKSREYYIVGAVVVPFVVLSMSKFKLPHYIYVVFPFICIMVAKTIVDWNKQSWEKWMKAIIGFHIFQNSVFVIGSGLLLFTVFSGFQWGVVAIYLLMIGSIVVSHFRFRKGMMALIVPPILGIVLVNMVLNLHFYPNLQEYDAGYQASQRIRTAENDKYVYTLSVNSFSIEMYSGRSLRSISRLVQSENAQGPFYVYCNDSDLKHLQRDTRFSIVEVEELKHYHVTALTLNFLNPNTRPSVLEYRYLVTIHKK